MNSLVKYKRTKHNNFDPAQLSLHTEALALFDDPDIQLPDKQLVEDALAVASLRHFIPRFWKVVEPKDYVPGWHIDAICDHLEALFHGDILKLIINIPPRYAKSLTCSVFFCPWVWLNDASLSFLCSSYADTLSTRDSRKTRLILQDEDYMRLMRMRFPKFALAGDQNAKTRYYNTYNGYRIATGVGGVATGEGGDFNIIDDPHKVKEAESDAKRLEALQWIDETMSTRRNDPKRTRYLVIMQRVHENDMTGHLLAKNSGWEHLCLALEYEGENRCHTSLGFVDPRRKEGQLLWPNHWDAEAVADEKLEMTEYSIASQLQQRPSPRGGGMIPVDKFVIVHDFNRSNIKKTIRYWDKAATEGGGKRTAGCLMHALKDGSFLIENVTKGQWGTSKREARIKITTESDYARKGREGYKVWIEQEPGSSGKDSVEASIQKLAGYSVKPDKVTGSKVDRADPFADQVGIGNVKLLVPRGDDGQLIDTWVFGPVGFIHECELFPMGRFSDQVDAASGAFNKLALGDKTKKGGAPGRKHRKGTKSRRRMRRAA